IELTENPSNIPGLTIQALDGSGHPDGTVLATGAFSGAYQGIVVLDTPVAVVAETQYAMVFPDGVGYQCTSDGEFARGEIQTNGFPGPPGWSDVFSSTYNMDFSTYVQPYVPYSVDATASTVEDAAVDIPLAVTGYLPVLTVDTPPAHGSVTFAGTTATYTPSPGFSGTDTFTYIASNSGEDSPPGAVTITVAALAPVLAATGVTTGWFVWLGGGLLLLGVIAIVLASVFRARRRGSRAAR
ncbi:MAG TPA: Ig-like domain-containing protein, partial [Pseudolysinimonas sp.]|nr:Ig-like domain-containing protein [Pseudolysinimonas sp.]